MEFFRPRLFFDAALNNSFRNFDCFLFNSLEHEISNCVDQSPAVDTEFCSFVTWCSQVAAWASVFFECFWIWFRWSERGLLNSAGFVPVRGSGSEAERKLLSNFFCFAVACFCLRGDLTYPHQQCAHSILSCLNQHFENWKTESILQYLSLSWGALSLASYTACVSSSSCSSLAAARCYGTALNLRLDYLMIFLEIAKRSIGFQFAYSHLCSTGHKTHTLQPAALRRR